MPSTRRAMPLDALAAPVPPARLLSSGSYTVLITSAGTGYSTFDGYALLCWRGDPVEDLDGFFVYVRDTESDAVWSAGLHPTLRSADAYEATWRPGRFEIVRRDHGIATRLEMCVMGGAPLEVRRVALTNHTSRRRVIELTSCGEVVLAPPAAHAAHPVFSKLFLQTEYARPERALLARRRPRSAEERHPWLVHALLDHDPEYETDRGRFLGRRRRAADPRALDRGCRLSGTVGNVLDPIVSLRCAIEIEPGETRHATFVLGAAAGRDEALSLLSPIAGGRGVDAVLAGAEAFERQAMARVGATEDEAEYFQSLAGAILYGHPDLRAPCSILARIPGDEADLAPYGVASGRALVVAHARGGDAAGLRDLARANRYWREKRLPIDLVVVAEDRIPGFDARAGNEVGATAFLQRGEVPDSVVDRIDAAARLLVEDALPDLGTPVARGGVPRSGVPTLAGDGDSSLPSVAARTASGHSEPGREAATAEPEKLSLFNGRGGFAAGGEYVIRLAHDRGTLDHPPHPWINVIANEGFGCLVSETGAGCTWSDNSREYRLTPWHNEPVTDPHDEAWYIRDKETGEFWSPLPGPVPAGADYEMRHGFGYSICMHASHGLEQRTTVFVSRREPVRITTLQLTNSGRRRRRLSVFGYYRLVLGSLPEESARSILTSVDRATGAVFARNPLAGPYADIVAFSTVVCRAPAGADFARAAHVTCDRHAFIGRSGDVTRPRALRERSALDGRAGAGLDPCIAHQIEFELGAGEAAELSFLLGAEHGEGSARKRIDAFTGSGAVERALEEVKAYWRDTLGAVRVSTPSPAMDVLVNGWLPYQALACRLFARTALYQSGGAFGFRDQLQDAASVVLLAPELTRDQILLHAAHQFEEGDVLHWWHPPHERGLRTRFADDLLWLPYLTAYYVEATGDRSVLDETVPFLRGRVLAEGEDEAYLLPELSRRAGSVYEHCCKALDRSLVTGDHGLPLFGSGDWNDGMNRVGREGKGESVWLGFFLYRTLEDFARICAERGDGARVERYPAHCDALRAALERDGWDGEWYRRGYYDDGAPLGSSASDECRIDALAQSWAVISGAAPRERASIAMNAVERHLVSEEDGLIRLLTPPFESSSHDPGYIKGYVPGVRENGGQYTHAAVWVVQALAELGRRERAMQLWAMIGPVHHTRSREEIETYRVEPYVVAADIYGAPPHVGHGGWTWYTGSAGWMYRVAIETLLGCRLSGGDTLIVRPCVPDAWPSFTVTLRLPDGETAFEVRVTNPGGCASGVVSARTDGRALAIEGGAARVPLQRDGRRHIVDVVLGAAPGSGPGDRSPAGGE